MIQLEEILSALKIKTEEIVNVYPYGSKVYGTADENSDDDFIIVYKSAFLPNRSFRNNAISSTDRKIQAVCYSRTGFQDAINNYEIGALECLSLSDEIVLMKKWPFKIQKWNIKDLGKKIISKASASWYVAQQQYKDDEIELAKKGVYHTLRILEFGQQLKEHGKIIYFNEAKNLKEAVYTDENFKMKNWIEIRDLKMQKLK